MIAAIGVVLVTSLLAAIFYDLNRRARLAELVDKTNHDARVAALRVRKR